MASSPIPIFQWFWSCLKLSTGLQAGYWPCWGWGWAGAGGHRVIFSNKVVQQQSSSRAVRCWSGGAGPDLCPHPLASPGPGYLICLAPDPATGDESRDLQLLTINLPRNDMGFKRSTRSQTGSFCGKIFRSKSIFWLIILQNNYVWWNCEDHLLNK